MKCVTGIVSHHRHGVGVSKNRLGVGTSQIHRFVAIVGFVLVIASYPPTSVAQPLPAERWEDAGGTVEERLVRRWAFERKDEHTKAEGESHYLNLHIAKLGYENGLAELDAAVKAHPLEPDALYFRGKLQILNRKQNEGMADFKAILAMKPRHAYDHGTRASVYNWVKQALGQPAQPGDATAVQIVQLRDLAIKELDAAIQLNPKYALAYHDRSMMLDQKGDLEGAMRDITRAIELAPDQPTYLYMRAAINWRSKQPDNAIADLTKAINLFPQYDEAYRLRGIYYIDLQQPQKAIADFDTLIRRHPKPSPFRSAKDVSEIYFLRGTVHLNFGTTRTLEAAQFDLTTAIEFDPKNPTAYANRALVYQHRKMIALANADRRKAEELKQGNSTPAKKEK